MCKLIICMIAYQPWMDEAFYLFRGTFRVRDHIMILDKFSLVYSLVCCIIAGMVGLFSVLAR
jgi:hypothetical protein